MLDEEIDVVEELARDAVSEHRDNHDSFLPYTMGQVERRMKGSGKASKDDVDLYLEEIMDHYDELYEVDSGDIRKEIGDEVRYDESVLDILSDGSVKRKAGISAGAVSMSLAEIYLFDMGTPEYLPFIIPANILMSNYFVSKWQGHDGVYNSRNNSIGIGHRKKNHPDAYWRTAAELSHAYHDKLDSPVYGHPMLTEGFERATTLNALDHAVENKDEDFWKDSRDSLRTHVLLNGYAQIHSQFKDDSNAREKLPDIGIDSWHAWHLIDKPWDTGNAVYNVGASLVLAREEIEGERAYADIFHGEDYLSEELNQWWDRLSTTHRVGHNDIRELWDPQDPSEIEEQTSDIRTA